MAHGISWLNAPGYKGETLNPIVGCTPVSEGCKNCYAREIHNKRHRAYLDGKLQNMPQFAKPFSEIQYIPDRLIKPRTWKKPRFIFWCDMSDMFHDDIINKKGGFHTIFKIIDVIRKTPQHRHIILTKRPENALKFQNEIGMSYPDNLIFGVSCSNQEDADRLIPDLLKLDVKTRAVSLEPLLGPIDLSPWIKHLHWVIPGGESGTNARPCHPDWVRSIRDQCEDAGVAFYFKQWGNPLSVPNDARMYATIAGIDPTKRNGGHLLDGVEYHEFPEVLT